MLFAHLVCLQSGSFFGGRAAFHAGGQHPCSGNYPFSCGHIPGKCAVCLHKGCDVLYLAGLQCAFCLIFGLVAPHIGIPHRQRGLPHLHKRLFGVAFHTRNVRQFRLSDESCVVQCQAEFTSFRFGQRKGEGSQRLKTNVLACIAAIKIVLVNRYPLSVFQYGYFGCSRTGLCGVKSKTAGNSNFVALERNYFFLFYILLGHEQRLWFIERIGQHLYVLSVLAQSGKLGAELHRALYGVVHRFQITHGLAGLHPRTAALAPSRAIEQSHLYVQLCCGAEHGVQNLPPLIAEQTYRTHRSALSFANHTNLHTVYAGLFHGMQVFYHTLF